MLRTKHSNAIKPSANMIILLFKHLIDIQSEMKAVLLDVILDSAEGP